MNLSLIWKSWVGLVTVSVGDLTLDLCSLCEQNLLVDQPNDAQLFCWGKLRQRSRAFPVPQVKS